MKRLKRATAILLTLTMFLTMAPAASFAAPVTEEETNVATVADDMATPKAGAAVYVSAYGSDESGNGSERYPYASLAQAVEAAEDGAIIYVMSDLTANTSARYWDKHLTITSGEGGPFTITRGDSIPTITESARQTYNGALLEVGGGNPGTQTASLTLTNIIFDDKMKHTGEYFIQADSESDGKTHFGSQDINNTSIVQDAIIATYNGTSEITLGNGAVLKNFGGMSALRLSGGTVIMQNGSAIYDDIVTDRTRGTAITGANSSYYGPAGAVWIQGGTFTMENGATIGGMTADHPMIGRAFYVDGGDVTINGTIANVVGDADMWWPDDGIAIHARNNANVTLDDEGIVSSIYDEDRKGDSDRALYSTGAKMAIDGIVENCTIMNVVYWGGSREDNAGTLNGTVRNNLSDQNNGYTIVSETSDLFINAAAKIENNRASIAPIYAPAGANVDIYGTIQNNTGGQCAGVFLYGNYNGGRTITVDLYDGAKIINNTRNSSGFNYASLLDGLKDRGGAICSGGSSHGQQSIFTMHGGTISGNSSNSGAILIRKNGHAVIEDGNIVDNKSSGIKIESDSDMPGSSLIVNNGIIANNSRQGVSYTINYDNYVNINGGAIYGNNGGEEQISAIGGSANITNERIYINQDVLSNSQQVTVSFGDMTLDENYSSISLGKASTAVETQIKDLIEESTEYPGEWTAVHQCLWFKPTEDTFHFLVNKPSSVENGRALYAAYIPLNEDGSPVDNSELEMIPLTSSSIIEVSLDNLNAGTSYGLMFVLADEYTLKPDDITIYTGGEGTDENETNGLPEPTMLSSIPSIKSISVNGTETTYKTYGDDPEVAINRLMSMFDISYIDETTGEKITDDKNPGVYTIKLAVKSGGEITDISQLKINGNTVKIADGELTIRYVSNVEDAANEELTTPVQAQVSEAGQVALANGKAFAVIEDFGGTGYFDPKFYTNGNENAELEDVSGVSLFFDDLLPVGVGDDTTIDRTQALKEKADAYLSGKISNPQYDLKYLDLVDQKNGNAWVASDSDITIHWPLPADTNEETKFTVLHFTGLHREYGAEYTEAELERQINDSVIEEIEATVSGNAVTFTLPGNETQGSFSPFALVWQGEDEPVVTTYTITATAGTGGSITPSGAMTVEAGMDKSFTIKADAGYTIADVKVDGISVGAVSSYSFEDVAANHTIEATFESSWVPTPDPDPEPTPDPDEPDTPDEPEVPDVDLPDDLNTVDHFSYVVGYEDGTVMPQKQITRAEVATIFYRLLKDDVREDYDTTRNNFSDVTSDSWYNQTVSTLASMGILKGYEDGTIRPNASITRAEFAAIATRFFEETGATYEPGTFTDVTGSEWFAGAIMDAVNLGLIGGYEDGTVRPNNNITRAEACAIVNRTLGRVPDADHLLPEDVMKTWPDNPESAWFYADMQEATNGHEYEWITEDGNKIEEWTDILDKDWNDR